MVEIRVDDSEIIGLADKFRAAGNQAPHAIRRAVNWTGDRTDTQVVRALTKQTGLKRVVIRKAVKRKRANYGDLSYRLKSRGGNVRLKFFAARETRKGVSAAPFGQRAIVAHAFIKGGRFPKRVPLAMGGHVFMRTGSKRLPIEARKSGVFIPVEMVSGATAAAFLSTVNALLPARVGHELSAILAGHAPRG